MNKKGALLLIWATVQGKPAFAKPFPLCATLKEQLNK
jgi:hypothetical protein